MKDFFNKIDSHWHYRPLLWVVVAFLCAFLLWSSVTTVDEYVRGMGRVVPAGKVRVIQHLEGGIVNEINIAEGQKVEAGDILFYVANKRAEADLRELAIAMKAMEIKRDRLQAEIDQAEDINYPKEIREAYPEIVESEQQLFKARRAEQKEKTDGLEKRMKQKVLKLDELNTTIKNLERETAIAREQLEIKTQLRRKGAISRSQYLEAESEVKNFETRIASVKSDIPITKSELAEIINLLEETRQSWQSEVGEELNVVKVNIKKLGERMLALQDQVKRTAVQSPVKGIVNKIYVHTIGGVIQPGERLAEIIPLDETLIVEGRITTNDRGKVWPDLPVVAKITAYDYTIYGGIDGKLTYISADSFIDSQNREYYQVQVSLDATTLDGDKPVFPGMTAELNIIAGKVSVLHALLRPLWNIRNNALREL